MRHEHSTCGSDRLYIESVSHEKIWEDVVVQDQDTRRCKLVCEGLNGLMSAGCLVVDGM